MIRICKPRTNRIENIRMSQVIGYLLDETFFSVLYTHRCVSWCKTSFLSMSHGQKSLKATALDKFSYIYTSRRVQEGLMCLFVIPQSWKQLSCPSDRRKVNYTLVIKWNAPCTVVNEVVLCLNTNASQCRAKEKSKLLKNTVWYHLCDIQNLVK